MPGNKLCVFYRFLPFITVSVRSRHKRCGMGLESAWFGREFVHFLARPENRVHATRASRLRHLHCSDKSALLGLNFTWDACESNAFFLAIAMAPARAFSCNCGRVIGTNRGGCNWQPSCEEKCRLQFKYEGAPMNMIRFSVTKLAFV